MAERQLVRNAADPKQVKNASDVERRQAEQKKNDTLWVLSSVQGRRFFWNLMASCNVFADFFSGNSWDARNLGRRSVGLELLNDLNDARPEAYLEMLNESKKAAQNQPEPEKGDENA